MASMRWQPFPTFKGFDRLNGLTQREALTFYDVKFYPYLPPGMDPIFAVVGGPEILICRPTLSGSKPFEVISWTRETEYEGSLKRPPPSMNSCVWSVDSVTGHPLLCVAGKLGYINVFDVLKKKVVRTIIGHGKEINDLAVSPLAPNILVSASNDHTVRICNLDKAYEKQPCLAICAGEGHKEGLLSLAYHNTGRFLLTAGMDCRICMWMLPDKLHNEPPSKRQKMIHYPHFMTSAIHTNYTDCVTFYDDLILSKCANEHKIVLWRIEGFSSTHELSLSNPTRAPTSTDFPNRSAYGGTYQRLLQFDCPPTQSFYIRFSLFSRLGQRPMLACGNEASQVFLWDLQRLEEWAGSDSVRNADAATDPFKHELLLNFRGTKRGKTKAKHQRGGWRGNLQRAQSFASETTNGGGVGGETVSNVGAEDTPDAEGFVEPSGADMEKALAKLEEKYKHDNPFGKPLKPHHEFTVPKIEFATRQVAWSVGGEWMVAVGDQGMIAVFGREMVFEEGKRRM